MPVGQWLARGIKKAAEPALTLLVKFASHYSQCRESKAPHLPCVPSHMPTKMAKQMFFQFHIQTSLPGGSCMCQVPAQSKILWLDSKPLTIGGSNEMLTDP